MISELLSKYSILPILCSNLLFLPFFLRGGEFKRGNYLYICSKPILFIMRTREVSVRISHYTLTKRGKAALFSITSISEDSLDYDWDDKFLSDKSLEEILTLYTDKVNTYALNFDDVFSYRIVVRDEDCRLVKIFNA